MGTWRGHLDRGSARRAPALSIVFPASAFDVAERRSGSAALTAFRARRWLVSTPVAGCGTALTTVAQPAITPPARRAERPPRPPRPLQASSSSATLIAGRSARTASVATLVSRPPACTVSECAGSAQDGREHATVALYSAKASQAIESCKQQSSSAAGGGLTAGIGQTRPRQPRPAGPAESRQSPQAGLRQSGCRTPAMRRQRHCAWRKRRTPATARPAPLPA